jgi:O-antigen/teichoic acid export membrane protein
MAVGAGWMIGARLLDRGLGLLSTLVLARLLVPEDFGLIAMATAIVALLEAVSSFGFDAALIRHPNATRRHFDTTWTLHVLLGLFVGAGLLLAIAPAVRFFDEVRLVPIMALLALLALVRGLENVGVVALEKELRFRRAFVFIAGKKVAMFCTAIPLAFVFADYRALLAGMAAGTLAGVALSYALHNHRPRLTLSCWRELFAFSKWLLLKNLLDYFRFRYADIVVGRVAGPSGLGVFSIGAEIATLPTSELVAPINRAVLPGYAQMTHDLDRLRTGYLAVLGLVAVVGLPAALGIAAVAPLVVPVLLGPNWSQAIEVVQTLAWVGAVQVLVSNGFPIFLAIGKPWIATALSASHAALLVVALPVAGVEWGLPGVAYGVLAVSVVLLPVSFAVLLPQLRLSLPSCLAVLVRPVTASVMMHLLVATFVERVAATGGALALLSAVALGVGSYVVVLAALWLIQGRPAGAELTVLRYLRARFTMVRTES